MSTPVVLGPPFPGLRPFSYRDHEYFFGREDQVASLYRLLTRQHFIAVVGGSGSGKSSIVRAGLLPLLDQENSELPTPVWRWTAMRPGVNPIDRLADALAKTVKPGTDRLFMARRDRIVAILRSSRSGIAGSLGDIGIEPGTQLVILVDQFEELFRYITPTATVANSAELAKRREVSTHFVQLLLEATRSHDSVIRVLITMRSDFIGDCARFQGLPEAVSVAQFLVPALTRDQREEIIRRPLGLANVTIGAELVERLLNDSSDEIDQLPLLQHCLARLWTWALRRSAERSSIQGSTNSLPGPHITEATYREIGGLSGAISGHANEIYARLSGSEEGVERVFQALAEIDKDGRIIRRARTLAQIIEETGCRASEIFSILDHFRADECSFLVPPLSSGQTGSLLPETIIDVGHEALLRCWERVSGEPGASGERGDKRRVGWLRDEQRDGSHYQFLRSCLDPESPNESRLSSSQTRRSWDWWERRKPNAAWAARYGGSFEEVEDSVKQSFLSLRRTRLQRLAGYAFAGVALLAVAAVAVAAIETHRETQNIFRITAKSAKFLSSEILDQFNSGAIKLAGARTLHKTAEDLYRSVAAISETPEVVALRTEWLLADSDMSDALQDKQVSQDNVDQALKSARSLVALDPTNSEWQELLYESLFRKGDLLLGKFLDSGTERALLDGALWHYSEGRTVADRMSQPKQGSFELADSTSSEDRAFRVVFTTNKIGEALLLQENYDGALAKFHEALTIAHSLDNSRRMERRLQSALTLHKIASTLTLMKPPAYSEAENLYSEEIPLEERALASDPGNHIAMANLAAAYGSRAITWLKSSESLQGVDENAIDYFVKSEALLKSLAESDDGNIGYLMRLAQAQMRFGDALKSVATKDSVLADRARVEAKLELETRNRICQRLAEGSAGALPECKDRVQHLHNVGTE
jgi:tetratricopeptide (TPR) repeat protein